MEEHFNKNDPIKKNKLKMFLDIHAHSASRDIFIFAPTVKEDDDMLKVRNFPAILNNSSHYFNFEGCKFANEAYKKNCARLAVFRDFNIFHSYTIESSCWGYSIPYSDDTVQWKESDLIKFGKHLAQGIAKQFSIDQPENPTLGEEEDDDPAATPVKQGIDIDLEFALEDGVFATDLDHHL